MQNLNSKMKQLAQEYFMAWNKHDLDALADLGSPDIVLRDWEISVCGRENFLQANRDIFDNDPSIFAEVISLFENENEIIAILSISSLGSGKLYPVIDHIVVQNDKIVSITAYRGF